MTQLALRIVVFSPSIISDLGNPQATTVRAMCEAFLELGCDVTHLEQRGNEPLHHMLTTRGYRPMRSFNVAYPGIRYRQYDIPDGLHRSVWFSRELGTADVVVVYPGSPSPVLDEVAGFEVRQVLRFWPNGTDVPDANTTDWFDPAAFIIEENSGPVRAPIALTYGVDFTVENARERFNLGELDVEGFAYLPEVELGLHIKPGDTVCIPAGTDEVRILNAVAVGAHVRVIGPDGSIEEIDDIPHANNAAFRALRLRDAIEREIVRRSTD